MAPPVYIECKMTSSRVNTTFGPVMATAAHRALVIVVLYIDVHFYFGT